MATVSPEGWHRFFDLLNCSQGHEDPVECAQRANTKDIVRTYIVLFKEYNRGYVQFEPIIRKDLIMHSDLIGPSIDGHLVQASPYALLKSGRWARQPFIMGSAKDEGTVFAPADLDEAGLRKVMKGSGQYTRSNDTIDQLLEIYPADPSVGS